MSDATTGDIFAALYAAHQAGDYWVQTEAQARDKGMPGARGRRACAAHVATVTACKAAALLALRLSGRRVSRNRAVLAVAADALSHYWADRRNVAVPSGLPRLAFATGHEGFWLLGTPRTGRDDNPCLGTGGHAMDQAFHISALWVAALIAGGGRSG